jgi:hypothetical protein
MQLIGDSWYATELGIRTVEDEPLPHLLAKHLANPIVRGFVLWWRGRAYDRVVLVGGAAIFNVLVLLERLRPRGRPYLILLEFRPVTGPPALPLGWRRRVRRRLGRSFQAWVIAPVLRSALVRAQTLASWEVDRYAHMFGVEGERFDFIPFPLRLSDDELPPLEDRGRRVVASGREWCDWPLVFAAAQDQDWELEIVCSQTDRAQVERLNRTGAARVQSEIPVGQHRQLVREASVYLLALSEAEVSSGQVRVFEATRQGTPLVAADVRGLADYVSDGETALLFAPGDAAAARAAVNRLLDDRDLAGWLRRSAFERGRLRTRDAYLLRIEALIHG